MSIIRTNIDGFIFENKRLDVENVDLISFLKALHMKSILPIYVRWMDCILGDMAKHVFPQISNHNVTDFMCTFLSKVRNIGNSVPRLLVFICYVSINI